MKELLINELFTTLNENVNYAVLRNYEGLPDSNNSRDIDIMIERSDYINIKKILLPIIEKYNWKIFIYLKSDRIATWICGCVDNLNSINLFQLDFFFQTSAYGISFITAKEILKERVFNGKVYHVSKEYEFLDKYLYNRAVGKQYPIKYIHKKIEMEFNSKIIKRLNERCGCKSIEECDSVSNNKIIFNEFIYNCKKNVLIAFYNLILFLYYYIKNLFFTKIGVSIGFTGVDGSGKTTIIKLIITKLSPIFQSAYKYYHFRPNLFDNLGEITHKVGLKKKVDRNYDVPHRSYNKNCISSIIRLFYYSTDYILGYILKIKSVIKNSQVVIFDRYFTDIIVDSRRSSIYLNYKFLYMFDKLFIPSLSYNIVLNVLPSVVLNRKKEMDVNDINEINDKISFLSKKSKFKVIANNDRPENAVYEILSFIFEEQNNKNLKRLI